MISSGPLFEEIGEKLLIKLHWPVEKVEIADRILRRMNEKYAVRQLEQQVCRDRDEDWVLATAEAARCEYLVTGDGDLLVLGEFKGAKIVRPAEFGTIIGLPRS